MLMAARASPSFSRMDLSPTPPRFCSRNWSTVTRLPMPCASSRGITDPARLASGLSARLMAHSLRPLWCVCLHRSLVMPWMTHGSRQYI